MHILLRLLLIPAVWLFVRRQRSTRAAIIGEIEGLSMKKRLKLTWSLARDRRVPVYVRPFFWLPAIYLASPIDLIPDFVPGLGGLDDAFVASTAYSLLARFVPPAVLREHVDSVAR